MAITGKKTTTNEDTPTPLSPKKTRVRLLVAFLAAFLLVALIRGFAFTSCFIPSSGMENSLLPGERILVNKWSYGLRIPLMSWFGYHRWGDKRINKGDIVVFNNPAETSSPVADRKEVFISRCIGAPGDTLLIDSLFSVRSSADRYNPDKKRLYAYPPAKEKELVRLLTTLAISPNELMGSTPTEHVRSFSRYEYYLLSQAIEGTNWIHPVHGETAGEETPLHPLIIPGKGEAVRVYPWNRTLLRNTLLLHEGKQAEIKNDTLYVEGKPVQYCHFTKDYYWMASNNSLNLNDSRLFGLVPKDHVIGKASLIWFSKEKKTGPFKGYRWKRFFRPIK